MSKGDRVLFHSGTEIYEGRVVSARRKNGCVLIERERINPDVQEARWWRTESQLIVLGRS